MNYRVTTILLAVALLFVLGVSSTHAAPYFAASPGDYDFGTHGTDWVSESPGKVALTYKGWGAIFRAKTTAGQYWVHVPVPFPTRIANSLMKIKFVEFCAQSTNGASTKPVRMDLWEYSGQFATKNISWPADNAKHCITLTLTTPAFHQGLGISVLLKFANTTDKITMYKAWVRIIP
ncbi:MAG: hypothetical protein C4583_18990 [Anaerolineaceae bacterium]|nr:MAG: hypothetical protein C4583_18990 [Anaerolineaceae bacterium]